MRVGSAVLLSFFLLAVPAFAGGPAAPEGTAPAPAAEPPPCPLHMFEDSGGAFTTLSAWLVNPPAAGQVLGLPSAGYIHVHLGQGKQLDSLTLTECITDRIELGYGFTYMEMGDVPEDIERAFGDTVQVADHAIGLHTFSARLQALQEGQFGVPELPAITLGVHYKMNETIDDVDDDLGGALRAQGIEDDESLDYTLSMTKMFTFLPVPFALTASVRYTEAAHCGLLGFTGDRSLQPEANVCVMAADWLVLAAEYRWKPSAYKEIPGLMEKENNWWTIDACAFVNSHLSIAVGYGHFGWLLNHKANRAVGIAIKYEF